MIDLEYIVLHLSTKISIMSRDSLGYFRRGKGETTMVQNFIAFLDIDGALLL